VRGNPAPPGRLRPGSSIKETTNETLTEKAPYKVARRAAQRSGVTEGASAGAGPQCDKYLIHPNHYKLFIQLQIGHY
jgi:hypothetical protein